MVRQTRFAFDDYRHPDDDPREHFSEEDERLLDGFSSPSKSGYPKTSANRKGNAERQRNRSDRLDPDRERNDN